MVGWFIQGMVSDLAGQVLLGWIQTGSLSEALGKVDVGSMVQAGLPGAVGETPALLRPGRWPRRSRSAWARTTLQVAAASPTPLFSCDLTLRRLNLRRGLPARRGKSRTPRRPSVIPGMSERAGGAYKPRDPRASPLFGLVEGFFDAFERVYDDRYEAECGFWRPVVRKAADAFLKCGDLACGFACVRCENPACRHELLVPYSCRGRYFCPSCHAKRMAQFAAWLDEEVLAGAPHCQYCFTIHKLLRVHFRFDRRLLGLLSATAWDSFRELARAAAPDQAAVPGMVASIQTFGDQGANWHPHLHAIVPDGVFLPDGTFWPVPPPDPEPLMLLFRHKLIHRLRALDKISEGTVAILDRFRHPGFSVHQGWPVQPGDTRGRMKRSSGD